jgi:hypothetical protein
MAFLSPERGRDMAARSEAQRNPLSSKSSRIARWGVYTPRDNFRVRLALS